MAAYIINPTFIKYSTKGIIVHRHVSTFLILHTINLFFQSLQGATENTALWCEGDAGIHS